MHTNIQNAELTLRPGGPVGPGSPDAPGGPYNDQKQQLKIEQKQ